MQLLSVLYMVVGAFAAITLHEYIKALVSYKLGDPLPKARGRLTLNPLNHFEPVGFICMIFTGYGWGKPVETAAVYYKDRKKGTILTYITPSVVNLLAGVVFSIACRYLLIYIRALYPEAQYMANAASLGIDAAVLTELYSLLYMVAKANVALALFNIIPVYPLDGSKILSLFLSPNGQVKMTSYEKIFQIILIIGMFTGWIGTLLSPLQAVFLAIARG